MKHIQKRIKGFFFIAILCAFSEANATVNSNFDISIQIENPIDEDEPSEIRNFLRSNLSEPNVDDLASRAKKALSGLSRYASIQCEVNASMDQTEILICDLQRHQIVRRILFEGVPLLVLQKELSKHIPVKVSEVIDPGGSRFSDLIKRSKNSIKSYLDKQGFFHATIQTKIIPVFDTPAVDILFIVQDGSYARVRTVELKGELPIDTEIVLAPFRHMCSNIRFAFEGLFQGTKACFNKDVEQQTIATVEERLADLGYVEAHVSIEKKFIERHDGSPNLVDIKVSVRPLGPKLIVNFDFVDAQVLNISSFVRFFRFISGVEFFSRILKIPAPGAQFPEDQSILHHELESALTFRTSHVIDDAQITESISALQEVLRARGYMAAKIESTKESLRGEWVRVNFTIKPGIPTAISSVKLVGSPLFSFDDLSNELSLSATPRAVFSSGHFTQANLAKDTDLIRNFFISNGYTNPKIQALVQHGNDGIDIIYVAELGQRKLIHKYVFAQDASVETQKFIKTLAACKNPESHRDGDSEMLTCTPYPFREAEVENNRLKLIELYKKNSYLSVDPKASIQEQDGLVLVKYDFTDNSLVKAQVAELLIDGNVATRRSVIERELGSSFVSPGKFFTPYNLDEGLSRLRSHGVFSKLSLEPFPKSVGSNEYFVYLLAAENPTFTIDLTFAYDSDFLFGFGVLMHERNLFGSLLQLETQLQFGLFIGKYSSFLNKFSWPRFFGLPMEIQFKIPELLYEIRTLNKVLERHARSQFSVGVEWQFLEILRPKIEFQFRVDKWQTNFTDIAFFDDPVSAITSLDGLAEVLREPASLRAVLKPSVSLISLDNVFDPKFGYKVKTGLELSGSVFGNTTGFNVVNIESAGYYSFGSLTLSAYLHLQRALIPNPLVNWTVLKYESDFRTIGGVKGPRSYALDTVGIYGPLLGTRNEPTGEDGYNPGNFLLQSSLELRFPLIEKLFIGKLNGALFSDFGFVGICEQNFFCFDQVGSPNAEGKYQQLGLAVGVGIRYLLPVGPLTIDYGISPIDPGQNRINFQFGYPF